MRVLLTVLLGIAAAGLAACGGEPRGGIATARAEDIKERLQAVRSAVADGECDRAAGALGRLRLEVEQVPPTVRRSLRERLDEGVQALDREVPDDCADAAAEKEPTTEPTTEAEPPPATVPEPTQETVPEETAPTTPPETVAPPTEEEPLPELPDGTGGISPDAKEEGGG